jgi:hypothetical protein
MTNRLCSITNTTAQQATEQFADHYGGLLRIMIVAAPPSAASNISTTNPTELPEASDCTLCPAPVSPYVACGCSNMRWARANASNIRGFSATGWYAGSTLLSLLENHQPSLGVPIGLVRSSMGGTQIQLWSSPAALAMCNTTAPATFWRPYSSLFLSMILPMKGLSFAALTWWQGEFASLALTGHWAIHSCHEHLQVRQMLGQIMPPQQTGALDPQGLSTTAVRYRRL